MSLRFAVGVLFLGLLCLCGCATHQVASTTKPRPFDFQHDTFAYSNELICVYHYDAQGKWTSERREPKPHYAQHCFVVARSAKQFFNCARFAPRQPIADEQTYRKLIRKVVSMSPRKVLPDKARIVIPGYADLRAFSQAQERLLKEECGGAWESYVQRGHWRMLWPFSRKQQERVAENLLLALRQHGPAVVHLVRFPQLTINHAVLIYDWTLTDQGIDFITYDPNLPAKPVTISFDQRTRTFLLPANQYFPGGRVDLYEVYSRWDY